VTRSQGRQSSSLTSHGSQAGAVFGNEEKEPLHHRGIIASEPGLYFVGLLFLYAMSSAFLPGVGRDATHIAKHLAAREPNGRPTGFARSATR